MAFKFFENPVFTRAEPPPYMGELSDPSDRVGSEARQLVDEMSPRSLRFKFLVLAVFTLITHLPCNHGFGDADEKIDHLKGFLGFFFFNSQCDCRCGIPNREARIIGGEYLRSHEFPWMALIQVKDEIAVPGTLINDRYIITATSQMVGLTPYDLKVTLGQFDRCFPDVSSQNLSVSQVILHPDFSPGNRANDVALVKLSAPIPFEKRIQPICLATPGSKYTGQVATVVGWAVSQSETGIIDASCRPRKLGLPVLGQNECLATAFDGQYTSLDKSCVGIVGNPSPICGSDSGGPVMYRSYGGVYEIIGILSDKNDCSDLPSSALFTTINAHLKWIKNVTRDACYCVKT